MVDDNKVLKAIKIGKLLAIGIIILLIIYLISSLIITKLNQGESEKYFKTNGYTKTEGSWQKDIKNDDTTINYIYTPKSNTFNKISNTALEEYQEQISFKYDGDKTIDINYSFMGERDGNGCFLAQSASYNYKNKDFTCKVDSQSGDCTLQCNTLKKEAENFSKEIKEIVLKSKIK